MAVQTPDWVRNSVFYQVFPDRFARSERNHRPRGIRLRPWGSPPAEQGFQGGDLLGIVDRLDYLQSLGITALYLNPIFASAANHRYHTYDYLAVDPLLGGNEAFRELLDAAHARDMRVVLDGVFNHASRGFWAFHHILENGIDSPYLDWFHISDWPLHPYPPDQNTSPNYETWWGLPALPKFNVSSAGAREYLLYVARFWIEFGADGWRLDVPEEIDDKHFWQELRSAVKTANPDAYLVGEIWGEAQDWLQGDRFDAVMNYVFSRAAYGFFAAETLRAGYKPGGRPLKPLNAPGFARAIERSLGIYRWDVVLAQLNLMDSHDTARTLWTVSGDETALRLCALFQMTMPGAPCIYYGDEIGMNGATDPECRGAFPWQDLDQWNNDLLAFHRKAIALRHRYAVLRTGDYATLYAQRGIFAFMRTSSHQQAVVLFNTRKQAARISLRNIHGIAEGVVLDGAWNDGHYQVRSGALENIRVPARDALVLVNSET